MGDRNAERFTVTGVLFGMHSIDFTDKKFIQNFSNFIQTEKEHANGDINQTIDAGWPTNGDLSPNDDQCELKSPNSMQRPDSGVGESVRCNNIR